MNFPVTGRNCSPVCRVLPPPSSHPGHVHGHISAAHRASTQLSGYEHRLWLQPCCCRRRSGTRLSQERHVRLYLRTPCLNHPLQPLPAESSSCPHHSSPSPPERPAPWTTFP